MKIARFSRIGFILAAAGSAVGLGNIWKFPYIAGEYGGGAFVLIYLITVLLIGFSILIAEMLIGYVGRKDTVTSFEELAPKSKGLWKYGGFQGLAGLFIMIFYSVVIGWIFHYIVTSLTHLPATVQEAEITFTTMLHTGIFTQLFYHTIAFIWITYVLTKGIKGGIEKMNLVLMPTLMIILLGMFAYAVSLDTFGQAVDFMFKADWSKIDSEAFVTAVGHAFFTLSLGMGAIMTYSASMEKGSNLVTNAFWVVFLDTTIAIVAGLMLFTFLYQYGSGPAKGPGLVFISLPAAFYEMGIIGKLRVIENHNAPLTEVTAGQYVCECIVVGKDHTAHIPVRGQGSTEFILQSIGSAGTSDPLKRVGTAGWKGWLGAKTMYPERLGVIKARVNY